MVLDDDNPEYKSVKRMQRVQRSERRRAMKALQLAMQATCIFGLKYDDLYVTEAAYKASQGPSLAHLPDVVKLSDERYQSVLAGYKNNDSFTAIIGTGCTFTCTNNLKDIEPGTLVKLNKHIQLEGIARGLLIEQSRQVQ